jgi:ATP-dependent protease ClpP protease subunit
MKNWYTIRARATGAEVLIYDEIGAYGVSAKGFLAEFGALPDDAPIDLRLNSPGGSVFDAVAIYNALSRHAGTITVWIDGIAASAASYIAMAGDEIVMPENAFMMIHDPSGVVMGTAVDMRDMAGTLDKIAASMTRGYAAKSGKPVEEIAALLKAETWFDAKDALEAGLATRMSEPVRIAASFDIARFRNAPSVLAELVNAESAAIGDDIVPEGNEVAADDDPPSAPDPATKVPAGNVDPVATADDPLGSNGQSEGVADGNTQANGAGSCVGGANTAPDATAIRAEAISHARAMIDLCRLAGQPEMAGRFLEEGASLDAVRTSLLNAKVEATQQITSHHSQPGRLESMRPWGDVIAQTFKHSSDSTSQRIIRPCHL